MSDSLRRRRMVSGLLLIIALAVSGCSKPAPDSKEAGHNPEAVSANSTAESVGAPESSAVIRDTDEPSTLSATTESQTANSEPSKEANATEEHSAAAGHTPPVAVMLGEESLYAGIPGEGPLTVDVIKVWLDEPGVHETLSVTLPLGLSLGQQQMAGLDENPLTRAKIELGRQLYFDKRLSSDHTISCASCHDPEQGWAAQTQFGVGVRRQTGNRNSPVSFNRILSGAQFWDGRAASLEEQAVGPIANPIEMGSTHEACVDCIHSIEGYVVQFDRIFGPESVNIDNIGKAIASFERAVVTGPSPYDYYAAVKPFLDQFPTEEDVASLKEDDPELYSKYDALKTQADAHPMSESAIRGRDLFFGEKSGCTQCHVGANFTDEKYHNLGVGMDAKEPDLGRFMVTRNEKDKGAFKTPTVRNVEFTGPYMHDGSQKTLEEVVEWYAKGGHPNPWLSEKIKKLDLTAQDKQDLVAFMKALSGPFPTVEPGRLPE